jgi:hypothetical protein
VPQEKIASLLLLPLLWLLFVMQLVRVRSSIDAKVMYESVLRLQNDYLDYVTAFQLVRH